jgi:hypothetical protein
MGARIFMKTKTVYVLKEIKQEEDDSNVEDNQVGV